jgi:hypothetical protein
MNDDEKTIDIGGHQVVLFDDSREEIDGVEKLKTMNCDAIDQLLSDAYVNLLRHGHRTMAHALLDLVFPIMEEREQAEYMWLLASDCPDDTGQITVFPLATHPAAGEPKPEDLTTTIFDGEPGVCMKRVKRQ